MTAKVNVILAGLLMLAATAQGVRVKDVGQLAGAKELHLIGYGLVAGLEGTGDSQKSLFTNQSLSNMLERFGISVESDRVRAKNVAAVMVTAEVQPFTKKGAQFDVTVASLGDAKSLQGSVLLQTTLTDKSGKFWAIATGPVSIGGFNIEAGDNSVRANYAAVGRVPDGGTLEMDAGFGINDTTQLTYMLRNGDFTTAKRMSDAINSYFADTIAFAMDPVSINIKVPEQFASSNEIVSFIAEVENIRFDPDVAARVIINERTGTIVIGEQVTISTVAISHGTLSITIKSTPLVSQPQPFSRGETKTESSQEIIVEESSTGVVVIERTSTVADVASALNTLGVTPRDIIAIFQALNRSGALQAELIII